MDSVQLNKLLRAIDRLNIAEQGGVYLIPETLAVLAQFTVQPSNFYIRAMNTLIRQLITDGNWNELDKFCVFATEQQQHARICWRFPTATPLTEVNSPTWTANKGYTGGGTARLDTNYVPSVNAVSYSLNSASFGSYNYTNVAAGAKITIGCDNGASISHIYPNLGGNFVIRVNAVNGISSANTDARGMYAAYRTGSSNIAQYKNGVLTNSSGVVSSTSLSNNQFTVLNNNASPFDGTVSVIYIASSNINPLTFYNAIQTFATTIGFNV